MWHYSYDYMSPTWYKIVYKNTVYKLKAMSHDDALEQAKKCHEQNMSSLRKCHGQRW